MDNQDHAWVSRIVTYYVGHEQEVNPALKDIYWLVEKQGKRSSPGMA
jgi:hypothetical protein